MTGPGPDPGPEDPVPTALRVALEALEERATSLRWMLTDRGVYGLADPDRLRRSLRRDQDASAVLRAAFDVPAPTGTSAPPTF